MIVYICPCCDAHLAKSDLKTYDTDHEAKLKLNESRAVVAQKAKQAKIAEKKKQLAILNSIIDGRAKNKSYSQIAKSLEIPVSRLKRIELKGKDVMAREAYKKEENQWRGISFKAYSELKAKGVSSPRYIESFLIDKKNQRSLRTSTLIEVLNAWTYIIDDEGVVKKASSNSIGVVIDLTDKGLSTTPAIDV